MADGTSRTRSYDDIVTFTAAAQLDTSMRSVRESLR
jgi:hypothetical protein